MTNPDQTDASAPLRDDLEVMLLERALDPGTEGNYRRSVRFFGQWLGRPATRADLVEQTVSRWLRDLEAKRSTSTVLGLKRSITVLWNWLAAQRLVNHYNARRLRRIRVSVEPPRVWTPENVRALIAGAAVMDGKLRSGLTASDLMTAWIHVGYETGMRPKDIRLLKRTALSGNVLTITQHKTKHPAAWRLSDRAMDALQPLLTVSADRLFVQSRNTIRRWELRLYDAAKPFGFHRERGCGIGTLRKTAATETCRAEQSIEAAARLLGHVSGTAIARRFYVGADALPPTPQPPSL